MLPQRDGRAESHHFGDRVDTLADTDTWIAALAAGKPLERGAIHASNQAARARAASKAVA